MLIACRGFFVLITKKCSGIFVFTSSTCLSLVSSGLATCSQQYQDFRFVIRSLISLFTLSSPGPCEESRPAARHLLGKSPALLDSVSRRHKLSHQQEVSKDEEELFWNFLQIYLILAETRHSSVSFWLVVTCYWPYRVLWQKSGTALVTSYRNDDKYFD